MIQNAKGEETKAEKTAGMDIEDNHGNEGQVIDEIKSYQAGRYLSAPEAYWRIFGFPINRKFPFVLPLGVHLPNHQHIFYKAESNELPSPPDTTLTAFFKLSQENSLPGH